MTNAILKLCISSGPRGPGDGRKLIALVLAVVFGLCAQSVLAEEVKKPQELLKELCDKEGDAHFKGGIIFGKDHAYVLTAPKGWVLDNQSGVDQGIHAVFYPEGGSWSDSKAVMYSRINDKTDKTFQEVIDFDLKHMSQDAPNYKIEEKDPVTCTRGAKAHIKYLSGDRFNTFEAVGYIEEPKKVITIVMTSREEKNFKSSVDAFYELVKSYFWMTDQVKIEK